MGGFRNGCGRKRARDSGRGQSSDALGKERRTGCRTAAERCVLGPLPGKCDFTFTFHFHALEKETATHSSVLAWRIPGTAEPGGLPSMGHTESDTTEVWNLQEVGVRDEDGCRRAVGSSVYEVILYTPIGHKGQIGRAHV